MEEPVFNETYFLVQWTSGFMGSIVQLYYQSRVSGIFTQLGRPMADACGIQDYCLLLYIQLITFSHDAHICYGVNNATTVFSVWEAVWFRFALFAQSVLPIVTKEQKQRIFCN